MTSISIIREVPPKRSRPEDGIQTAIAQCLKLTAVPGLVWSSVPNERRSSARDGARLKRMGLRPGAADLIMSIPPNGLYAALEIKSAKGRQSDAQKEFEHDVIASGGLYAVAYGVDEAIAVLKSWGAIRR